jgi:hypothetical protein
LSGDNDETLPVKMWDSKRPCFERGQENQFIVSYPQEVGGLSYVQIWHNNAGTFVSSGSGYYLWLELPPKRKGLGKQNFN